MSINTLAAARTLEGTGMPERQAEAVVEIVRQSESGEWQGRVERRLGVLETTLKIHTGLLIAILGVMLTAIFAFALSQ